MPFWIELIVSLFLLVGGVFVLLGSVGLARLPDFYTRLHAPTKATTLGVGCLLIGSMIISTWASGALSIYELLITIFLFITAPVSAHMLAKSGLHHRLEHVEQTLNPELVDEPLHKE